MVEKKGDGKPVAFARLRYTHVSPQKARLVVDQIRGKSIDEALTILRHSKRAVSLKVEKLLLSAVANAQAGAEAADVDKLFVQKAFVDAAPTMKRIQPRAMGRAFRIIKRFSHITVGLGEKGK